MTSKVVICNLAISHLGSGKEIANMTERSEEARVCNRFYDTVRDIVLADMNWPFATKVAALGLIETLTDANAEWNYLYRYPVDCLNLIRVRSGAKVDTRESRIPFKVSKDVSAKVIYCDQDDAYVEYIERVVDPSFYSESFLMALSFKLAAYIAPRITGGDPYKMRKEMTEQYRDEIANARRRSMNEEAEALLNPESDLIRARGY